MPRCTRRASRSATRSPVVCALRSTGPGAPADGADLPVPRWERPMIRKVGSVGDQKSTRLNSSHVSISYAVFCLKKKKNKLNMKQSKGSKYRIAQEHTLT